VAELRETPELRAWQRRIAVVTICLVTVAAVGAWAIWRVTQSGTLPDGSCGTTVSHNLGGATQMLSESDAGVLGCFSAAARGCKAASIGVTEMGIDSGAKYVFVIRSGGSPCEMTELSQSYGYTGGNLSTGSIISVPCRRAAVTVSGVLLSCARLDVLIPAAVAGPRARPAGLPSPSCGGQFFASHVDRSMRALSGTDPGVLACFTKAARDCRAASIGMTVSPGHNAGTGYVFRIEAGRAQCRVTELRQDWGVNGAGWWSGIVTSMSCHLTTVTSWGVGLRCADQNLGIPGHV
jgi:hypothetical protein